MKRTPEDTAFAAEFGRELKAKYDEAKKRAVTDAAFAKSVGVVRAQLDRYLRGEAVPGIRTVALAHREYGIALSYGGTSMPEVPPYDNAIPYSRCARATVRIPGTASPRRYLSN